MIFQSNTVTIYYVADNPNKKVTNLSLDSSPIYKFADLSWSQANDPGTYYFYWFIGGSWSYSGYTSTGTSIRLTPPSNASKVQIRTDDLYPSNEVDVTFVDKPETRVLTTTARYDGVLLDWTPGTLGSERVEIVRSGNTIFTGNVNSYVSASGGTFKVRFFKGTGSDTIYGNYSNSVTTQPLDPPPPRTEVTAPCEFYLGNARDGSSIFHMCNPAVVPDTPPTVEAGKDSVDWFQDWVGIDIDYGEDTYFHSNFSYIYCTSAVRISSYSTVDYRRHWYFSNAADMSGSPVSYTPTEDRMTIVVLVDNQGNRSAAAPVLTRSIEITDEELAEAEFSQGSWGYGAINAYFTTGDSFIRTSQEISSVEVYEFNIRASGRDIVYEDVRGTNNGIILNPDQFEVNGNDFSGMMLAYCGTGTDGEYVNAMNLNDVILPMNGNVDSLGIYSGINGYDIMQILGTAGGDSWDVEMTTGTIKRGDNIWFNAGRGRTRIKYVGTSTEHESDAFQFTVPEHESSGSVQNAGIVSATGISSGVTVALSDDLVRKAGVLGYTVTPVTWVDDDTNWEYLYPNDDRAVLGFSSFGERVLIHRMSRQVRMDKVELPSGDPYWEIWYFLNAEIYLKRVTDTLFVIEYDYLYHSFDGSGGEARTFSVPGFSFSFIGLA